MNFSPCDLIYTLNASESRGPVMKSRFTDRSYHEARARDELQRAEEAADPAVATIHRELAALHRRQLLALVDQTDRMNRIPSLQPAARATS